MSGKGQTGTGNEWQCQLNHHHPVLHLLQLGPEDRRWRSPSGLSHLFPGSPLRQQRHHRLPLPVRWLQLSPGELCASPRSHP